MNNNMILQKGSNLMLSVGQQEGHATCKKNRFSNSKS